MASNQQPGSEGSPRQDLESSAASASPSRTPGGVPSSAASGGDGRGAFPAGFIEDVRQTAGIVMAVEAHVPLKRSGRTLKGLCPFHSEKSPSFHVDEAKGFYHCFGCGAGGDVFKFVMQLESVTFPEAVRLLATRAGLSLPERKDASGQDQLRERIFQINARAQEVFQEELASGRGDARGAMEYLVRRGIGPDAVAAFGLGWAPDSFSFLRGRLGKYEERELTASGLLAPSQDGRSPYDRFRKRVTFPIRAVSDRIIGFGGRIVGEGEPKYLNSPETAVYSKGKHLYGLDRARAGIRRAGHVVLVEGYLDVVSLHAAGIDTAVAVLGTALTPEHAKLLGRFTRRVVLAFDGDEAGRRAARKSVPALLAEGLDVRVMAFPDGSDPDDHVRTAGAEGFRRDIGRAVSFLEFILQALAKEHDLRSPTGRVAALHEVMPLLAAVEDRVLRSELSDAACHGLGVKPELVKEELRRRLHAGRRTAAAEEAAAPPKAVEQQVEISHAEAALLAWMLSDGRVRTAFREHVDDARLETLPRAGIFRAILAEPEGGLDVSAVIERLAEDWERLLVGRFAVDRAHEPVAAERLEGRVRDLIEQLGLSDRHDARRRKAELDTLIDEAARRGDETAWKAYFAEAITLRKAIHQ